MNIQTINRLTAAGTALVDAYTDQVGELPGNGAVVGTRDRLLDELKTGGLPTRRVESWHYTDLKALLRSVPPALLTAPSLEVAAPLVENAQILAVLQGVADASATIDGAGIAGYAASLRSEEHTSELQSLMRISYAVF